MSETEKYIRENMFPNLETFGIKSSDDYILNMFDDKCDNTLFTYKGKERRIANRSLFRESGQTRAYRDIKPAKKEAKSNKKDVKSNFKDEVDSVYINDSLWIDMQIHYLLEYFKIK